MENSVSGGLKNITPEQGQKLVELLKRHSLAVAELELLQRILKQATQDRLLNAGWLSAQLASGRTTQIYKATVEGPNGIFAKLETITDVAQVESILDTTPSAKIEN